MPRALHLCHLNASRTRPEGVVGLIALLPLVVALLAVLRLAVLLLTILRLAVLLLAVLLLALSGLGSLETTLLGLSARVAALLGLSAVLRLAVLPLLGLPEHHTATGPERPGEPGRNPAEAERHTAPAGQAGSWVHQ